MLAARIDFTRTRAFAEGSCGNIYVNEAGRWPSGTVAAADYQALCQRLRAELLELRDPVSGGRCVREVVFGREYYHGESIDNAPDLVIVGEPGYQFVGDALRINHAHDLEDVNVFADEVPSGLTGLHRPEGMWILAGPGVRRGATCDAASIVDVPTTVLAMLGVAVPEDMDGRVVQEAFETPLDVRRGPSLDAGGGEASYSDEDESAVRERLQSLGYVE
jgi:predicted AlkP superfamily phosphohydrolase/phosphomutase